MISKCFNKEQIHKGVLSLNASEFFEGTILMYLNSYGTDYNFCEFFLQTDNNIPTAAILRYNTFLYCSVSTHADLDELFCWLKGFESSVIYINVDSLGYIQDQITEECAFMHKKGVSFSDIRVEKITASSDIMQISRMVNEESAEDVTKEYFLDLTYRTRHNISEIKGIYKDDELVSFLSYSCPCYGKSVVDLVYTKDNFRGNGYSSAVVKGTLNNEDTDYYLICELSLQGFYENLGFEFCGKCFKIVM